MSTGGKPGVRVAVLGTVEVEIDGVVVALRSRVDRGLVASLAMRAGRSVSREVIVADVWGDTFASGWRTNLKVAVSRLRRRLAAAAGPTARHLVQTVPDGYRLDVGAANVDWVRFERLVRETRRLLANGSAREAENAVRIALDLWRGEPLPELASSRAGQAEAAHMLETHRTAVELWHDAALAMGEHSLVIARLEVGLAEEPLRERRWEQLMLALYRAGRQADALRAYQDARKVLGGELGLEPGPGLRGLERAILAQDPSLDLAGSNPTSVGAAAASPTSVVAPPDFPLRWVGRQLENPLLGRDAERSRLVRHWSRVNEIRSPGLVLLEGGAGVGKTRLVAELVRLVSDRGARVHPLRFAPEGGLSALVSSVGPIGVKQPEGDLTQGSSLLFDFAVSVVRHVVNESVAQPTLVVLDDAQWADAQALDVARYVGNQPLPPPQPARVLVVVVLRQRPARLSGIAEVLRNVDRLVVSDVLMLEGLGPDTARSLLVGQLDPTLTEDLGPMIDALVRDTGGNPRYLVEYARHLQIGATRHGRGSGELRDPGSAVEAIGVPASLREEITERLHNEPPDVVGLLLAASVVGNRFDLAGAARAAGLGEDDALSILERATRSRIVQEVGRGTDQFQFATALDRRVVRDCLSRSRRTRAERRLAEHV